LIREWFIYMIRDNSGRLYTGISTDVLRRLNQHQQGKGARALRGKGPLQLVWQQAAGNHGEALRLEYRLKQWSKLRKEALLATRDEELWQALQAEANSPE
jgi:Predicted endonuclease containing a URI domain